MEPKADYVFESSWEVCNKVGGIYTVVKSKAKLLKENLEVKINFFENRPLFVELPISIKCKVINTDATLKGQTVSSSYKSAIINNNIKILVPPFIESGDEIIVDSRNLEYIKKIK